MNMHRDNSGWAMAGAVVILLLLIGMALPLDAMNERMLPISSMLEERCQK